MGSTVTSARVAGALLVERGLVTPTQFAEALEHQRAHGGELDDVIAKLCGLSHAEVAEVIADRDAASRLDIGAILFASGAVDEDALAEARARSAATSQPIGPILVEMGAISRLDLASALADQWADSPAQILPPPERGRALPGDGEEGVGDLRFAMAALEASVRAARDSGDDGLAVEELLRREDALAARVEALERAIDEPVEADPALVAEIRGIAEGLEALQVSLRDVASAEEVATLGEGLAEVERLRERLDEVARRAQESAPTDVVEQLAAQGASLAERLGVVEASTAELDRIRAELASLAERPAGDPELARRVDELGHVVEELAARPSGDPDLAARLEELARTVEALGMLAEASSGADGLHEAIAELAGRVEGALADAARADDVASALDDVRAAQSALEGLPARVEALEQREAAIAELEASVESLRSAADALAGRAAAVEGLAARADELAALPERTVDLGIAVDVLRDAVAGLTVEAQDLAELERRLAELERLPDRTRQLAETLDAVEATVAALAAAGPRDDQAEAIAGLRVELAAAAERIAVVERLGEGVASLRDAVAELAERPVADAGIPERVEALAARVEALSADALGPAADAAVAGVLARVEEVAARLERAEEHAQELQEIVAALRAAADAGPAPELAGERLDALERSLEGLGERVDGAAPASALAALVLAVEELRELFEPLEPRVVVVEDRISEVEARALAAQESATAALDAVRERLGALAGEAGNGFQALLDRIELVEARVGASQPDRPDADDALRSEVSALGDALEALRTSVAEELGRVEAAWAKERAALEQLVASVSAEGSGSGHGVADDGSAVPSSVPELARLARELERLGDRVVEQERSLVEHFARRERALIERLGAGTDIGQRLTDLALGLEDVRLRLDRVGGGGGGEGGASPEELAELKDALFGRLERLASSIDWRFQRLEGGPAAAAGRTDLHTRVEQLARVVEQLAQAEGIDGVDLAVEPSHDVFLALVPTGTGHQLVELPGDAPAAGDRIPAPFGKGELVVVAIGASPLPGDDRACVFVEPADAPAPA